MGVFDKNRLEAETRERLDSNVTGPVRLWIVGRQEQGPIRLLNIDPTTVMSTGECSWFAETVPDGERVRVKDYDIGRILNPMEVIAWSAK